MTSEYVSTGDDIVVGDRSPRERGTRDRNSGSLRRLRAVRLLEQVLAEAEMSAADVASALVVTRETLDAYRDGRTHMPLERQLCLALLVIAQVPHLARRAHRLRGQVLAETAFHARATKTHMVAPVSKHWR